MIGYIPEKGGPSVKNFDFRKLIALVLVSCMVIALCPGALAVDGTGTTNTGGTTGGTGTGTVVRPGGGKLPGFSVATATKTFALTQLYSRGMALSAAMLTMVAKASDNEALLKVVSFINKWVFGVSSGGNAQLEAELAEISSLCQQILTKLDKLEADITQEMAHLQSMLEEMNSYELYTLMNQAWDEQVEAPLEASGMGAVVDAYEQYLVAANACGSDGDETAKALVETKRGLFFDKLKLMSSYTATAGQSDAYYETMMYATDDIDKKMITTLELMLKELLDTDGGRYIDRAAQVAYLCYPTSDQQGAFVDQAVERQAAKILMTMLAYQEFMAMRAEYFQQVQENGTELVVDGVVVSAADMETHFEDRQADMIGMVDGSSSTYGGLVGAMEAWLESPIYLENKVGSGWIYLDGYFRAADGGIVTLTNEAYMDAFAPADYDLEAQAERVAPMIHTYYQNGPSLVGNVTSSAAFAQQEMAFHRNATVVAKDGAEASVRVYYVLDQMTYAGSLEMDDLELVAVSPNGYDFHLPNCDYYDLVRGVFTDGYNDYRVPATPDDLKYIMDDRGFTKNGNVPSAYFADALSYASGKALYLLLGSDTTYLHKYSIMVEDTYTGIPVMDMGAVQNDFLSSWSSQVLDQKDVGSTDQYALFLMDTTGAQPYSKISVTTTGEGGASVTVDGYGGGYAKAGRIATLTIAPEACVGVTGITIARADGSGVVQTLDSEAIAVLTDVDTGVVSMDLHVPYEEVTIQVATQVVHDMADTGICAGCGLYEPAQLVDGSYVIDNVGKLFWFAALVNGDTSHAQITFREPGANGKIVAALDFTGVDAEWIPIGKAGKAYEGIFDGGSYPITGIDGMLFGATDGATLQNILIESGSFGQDSSIACAAGSIVGQATGTTTLEACGSKATVDTSVQCDVGGLVGDLDGGFMMDCFYQGKFTVYASVGADTADESNIDVGGLVGNATDLSLSNSYAAASFMGGDCLGGLVGRASGGMIANSYFNRDLYFGGEVGTKLIPSSTYLRDSEAFASGEVAVALDRGRGVWQQDLGVMAYPEFSGGVVYEITTCQGTDTYSNETGPHIFGEDLVCDLCGLDMSPVIGLEYATLSFESEIRYNIYFTTANMTVAQEDMGLLLFDGEMPDGTVEDAAQVISGVVAGEDMFMAATPGIPAKNMGDTVYFKVYALLEDGSYVYSELQHYDAVSYAQTILGRETSSPRMKALVVAMLNYGAQAQLYFGYRTDALMNASLTEEQLALVEAYDEAMVADVVSVDGAKSANFVYDESAFTNRYPSVSFDGAFSINFYFASSGVPDDGMTFYYWDLETYDSVDVLSKDNATETMDMLLAGTNKYYGVVKGIVAKEIDETVFVVGVYEVDGVEYTTGILTYSLGKYCQTIAAKDTSAQQAFAQATAVYGYYAKEYFANL